MTTIAIMQPYFIPYAGYFRLFCTADLFVIFDCVQFLRRGWMHRNRLYNTNKELQWLTLPLKKAPQDILIKDLLFSENTEDWPKKLQAFPQLFSPDFEHTNLVRQIQQLDEHPIDFLISTLQTVCQILNLPFNIVRSSTLNLPTSLKGEERIIEIARHYGAKMYINPPGGKELYNPDTFKHHNLQLHFLSDYQGPYESILQRFLTDDINNLRNEIIKQSTTTNL